ncbi:uroporphyrinogen-III synthase [Variovorax terrae]|uniref:Uroporphyrinogen-III synthase n=1 Tax=Variovorax terrae TaxID=2923278 RepID=A0A9X1VWP4_9BURK|nr:uroporphyrinogen-III synthase [Variovorax terrae]MCJ0764340.1 uroporphyrinogen-III synthase [Variovorax terrae]
MRVVVTRPEREAQQWVHELAARGLDALALPLIAIAPVADLQPLQAAWRQLGGYAAVMFVSGNAVTHFFASKPPDVLVPWSSSAIKTRAWAPGPGTAQALREAGVAEALIDQPGSGAGQFDSEALWQAVGPRVRPGDPVLIVRGSDGSGRSVGRDWLASQLAAAGATADFVAAYERRAPRFDAALQAAAREAAGDGSVWLFSSSEAIGHLRQGLPAQSWERVRALATHPRIAQAARDAGFGVVCESRPTLDEVVASIESMQ